MILALVDYSYIAYRSIFVLNKYIRDENSTDSRLTIFVRNNILQQFRSIKRELEEYYRKMGILPEDIVYLFCEDRGSDARKEISKEYKSNRSQNKELFMSHLKSINEAKEHLKEMGCFFVDDAEARLEADDLIYHYIKLLGKSNKKNKNNFDKISEGIIVSNDSDLGAYVNFDDDLEKVSMLRIKSGNSFSALITDKNSFEREFKIPYNTITLAKALCGDRSDGIKGIRNFGLKTFHYFIDYLKQNIGEAEANEILKNPDNAQEVIDRYLIPFLVKEKPRGFASKTSEELAQIICGARKDLQLIRPITTDKFPFPKEIREKLKTVYSETSKEENNLKDEGGQLWV